MSTLSEDSVEGRRLKNRAIETVVDSMLDQGRLDEALAWTNQLPAGEAQTSALSEILEDWTRSDPDAALAYLETLSGRDDYTDLRNSMLRSWTRTDPAGVADYITELDTDDPELGRLTGMLIAEWGRYDLAAAGEWLNSQPPSEETDRAVAMFTFQAASEDPAGAMTWAESITSDHVKGPPHEPGGQRVEGAGPRGLCRVSQERGYSPTNAGPSWKTSRPAVAKTVDGAGGDADRAA